MSPAEALTAPDVAVTHRRAGQVRLHVVPCTLAAANAYVRAHHRHSRPVVGHRGSIAVADDDGTIRGVAIVGRPIARHLDDGVTAEVNRVATDGCPNACSALYGAAWRLARALGYRRLVTYTLPSESGASLRGAGWRVVAERVGGRSWSCPSRAREDHSEPQQRIRWEIGP